MLVNIIPFPDGTPVFPQLFLVPRGAVSLVSCPQLNVFLKECLYFINVIIYNARSQVPDAVPSWCVGVAILPLLCENQKTVGSVFVTGENSEFKDCRERIFGVKCEASTNPTYF